MWCDPARTPVTGKYVFENANLDTIDGLAGTLRSAGSFNGPLNRIQVEGVTDTPNFQIDVGGAPVPLTTRFTAIVDGSDGDTYLKQVDAKILNSELTAHGAVIGFEGVRGRQVEVDVTMPNGRIEDLLRLTVDSEKPILLGGVHLKARLVIPPEKKKVIDKLRLRGEFGLTKATFTDSSVQTKLMGLSRRGKGMNNDEPVGDVVSNLSGRLILENGTALFPRLTFSVPGAQVQLAGRYGMRSGETELPRKARDGGDPVPSGGRRRERVLSEGLRSVLQEARSWNGASDQDHRHAQSAEVRAGYV